MEENIISDTSHLSQSWIEGLALEELNMDESGIIHINEHHNPIHMLEESSIHFMDGLKEQFELSVDKFNQYRGGASSNAMIKVFKISNTVNDFMLYRNSLRLIITRKANDLININLVGNSPEAMGGNNQQLNGQSGIDIKAHMGPFNQITWRFDGELVNLQAVVKYYLSLFIRHSAR